MGLRRRGFALVLVLISVGGLFALATQGAIQTRAATVEARIAIERSRAYLDARAAATITLRGLMTTSDQLASAGASGAGADFSDPSGSDDSSNDPDVELPPFLRDLFEQMNVDLEEEARKDLENDTGSRVADGGGVTGTPEGGFELLESLEIPATEIDVALPGSDASFRVRLSDATGGLPVNAAGEEWIMRYMQLVGVDYDRALTICHQWLDWIDADSLVRERGAESEVYVRRGIDCPDVPMRAIEELLYLPAMTPEIFERIRRDLSIGGDGRIHAGTASRSLLASIDGMTPDVADQIVALRAAGSLDAESLERVMPPSTRDAGESIRLEPGPVWRVEVAATAPDGVMETRFEGLAVLTPGRLRAIGLKPM